MFLVTCVTTLRERTSGHARAPAHDAAWARPTSCRLRARLRAARRRAGAARRSLRRRAARARRRTGRPGARRRRGRRRPARHRPGPVRERLRAHRVPGGAVHAGFVLRSSCCAACSIPRTELPRRCSGSDVLPLSYAVDAMTAVVDQRRRSPPTSGATWWSSSASSSAGWPSVRRPCAAAPLTALGRRPAARRATVAPASRSEVRRAAPCPAPRAVAQRPCRKAVVSPTPLSRSIVNRFVAGDDDRGRRARHRASWSAAACTSPSTTSARTPSTWRRPRRPDAYLDAARAARRTPA